MNNDEEVRVKLSDKDEPIPETPSPKTQFFVHNPFVQFFAVLMWLVVVLVLWIRWLPERCSRPYGDGPRWLRRTWCLLFHWRHFCHIGGSDCDSGPRRFLVYDSIPDDLPMEAGVPALEDRPVKEVAVTEIDCLRHSGCYTCQFVWWTKHWTRHEVIIQ